MGGTDVEQVLGRQRHGEREHGQQQEDRLGRLQLPHLPQDLPLRLRRNPRVPQVASAGALLEPHPHPALPAVEPDKQHRKRSPGVPLLRPSVEQSGIRIAISIFSLLFWMPGAFYIFITPYMIYMKEEEAATEGERLHPFHPNPSERVLRRVLQEHGRHPNRPQRLRRSGRPRLSTHHSHGFEGQQA